MEPGQKSGDEILMSANHRLRHCGLRSGLASACRSRRRRRATDAVAEEPGPSLVRLRVVRPGKPAVWFCSDPHYGPSSSRERADGHVIQNAPLGDIPAWSHSRHLARGTARTVPRLPLLTVLTVSEPLTTPSLPCCPVHAPVRKVFRQNLATKSGTEAIVPPAQLQSNSLKTGKASETFCLLETTPIPYMRTCMEK